MTKQYSHRIAKEHGSEVKLMNC